jgi:hypothetical protein
MRFQMTDPALIIGLYVQRLTTTNVTKNLYLRVELGRRFIEGDYSITLVLWRWRYFTVEGLSSRRNIHWRNWKDQTQREGTENSYV